MLLIGIFYLFECVSDSDIMDTRPSHLAKGKCRVCRKEIKWKNYKEHIQIVHPGEDSNDLSWANDRNIATYFKPAPKRIRTDGPSSEDPGGGRDSTDHLDQETEDNDSVPDVSGPSVVPRGHGNVLSDEFSTGGAGDSGGERGDPDDPDEIDSTPLQERSFDSAHDGSSPCAPGGHGTVLSDEESQDPDPEDEGRNRGKRRKRKRNESGFDEEEDEENDNKIETILKLVTEMKDKVDKLESEIQSQRVQGPRGHGNVLSDESSTAVEVTVSLTLN